MKFREICKEKIVDQRNFFINIRKHLSDMISQYLSFIHSNVNEKENFRNNQEQIDLKNSHEIIRLQHELDEQKAKFKDDIQNQKLIHQNLLNQIEKDFIENSKHYQEIISKVNTQLSDLTRMNQAQYIAKKAEFERMDIKKDFTYLQNKIKENKEFNLNEISKFETQKTKLQNQNKNSLSQLQEMFSQEISDLKILFMEEKNLLVSKETSKAGNIYKSQENAKDELKQINFEKQNLITSFQNNEIQSLNSKNLSEISQLQSQQEFEYKTKQNLCEKQLTETQNSLQQIYNKKINDLNNIYKKEITKIKDEYNSLLKLQIDQQNQIYSNILEKETSKYIFISNQTNNLEDSSSDNFQNLDQILNNLMSQSQSLRNTISKYKNSLRK